MKTSYILKNRQKILLVLFSLFAFTSLQAQVKVWEEKITIPTLKVGELSQHPTFKREINMRADDDQIYPYTYNYKITSEYEDKSYTGCFLENEYIKVLVTPEIGGKLYGAIDKTNGYDFIYWQPTVKPALISLTGPWVSGGIEWCFPSGHRQTGYQAIPYQLSENEDGSKTIWVGETEWVHGLRWLVGLTVYPGKSVIEANIKLMNPTSMPQSQYMWANAATHADSSYQLIYPTEIMTNHNRADFYNWPKHDGKDISWWKNIQNASSYFAEDIAGFFGGYNHKQEAGTVFVGNKHIMTGKKFWTWGASPSGRLWDWVLSDGGGSYVEPQFGAYTTNQPDFHWLSPGEIKDFSIYLFPVKGIGAYKEANINGALNLEFADNEIKLGVYSTSKMKKGVVRLAYKKELVFEKELTIDPSKPYLTTLPQKQNDITGYTLSFLDEDGNLLITYSPKSTDDKELPEGVEPIILPEAYSSLDEIWSKGEFLYKNRDKNKAKEFFNYVLNKDSLDSRTNTSMAQMLIEEGEYEVALKHLQRAGKRNGDEGKLSYLKALAYASLGKTEGVYEAFYKSTHFYEFASRAYKEIACIDMKNGRYSLAGQHIDKAIEGNSNNPELLILKALIEQQSNNIELALSLCKKALEIDPMNFWAVYEKMRILERLNKSNNEEGELLNSLLLNDFQYYLQLANKYISIGFYQAAVDVCNLYKLNAGTENSLVSYYKGFCFHQLNKKEDAKAEFLKAKKGPINRIFPFRRTSIDVLKTAIQFDNADANANYFLGLLYAGLLNGEKANGYLLKAAELNPDEARIWRNLGYLKNGYPGIEKNLLQARNYYEKAFALNQQDDLVLMEFDQVREALHENPSERLKTLKEHTKVVELNDDLLETMIDLMVSQKEFKVPVKYFANHAFNNREGKYRIHNSYMNAYIGLAIEERNAKKALAFYVQATKYPDNLKVKPDNPNLRGFLYYPMAVLNGKLGNKEEKERLLTITAGERTTIPTIANYYRAKALTEMKDNAAAQKAIEELEKEAQVLVASKPEGYIEQSADFLKALGHYYKGLCYKFQGRFKESENEQAKAVKLHYTIEQDAIMIAQKNYK